MGTLAARAGPAARHPEAAVPSWWLDGIFPCFKPLLMTNTGRAGEGRATRPEGTASRVSVPVSHRGAGAGRSRTVAFPEGHRPHAGSLGKQHHLLVDVCNTHD